MVKRIFKWLFYAMFFIGGSVIAYFLPENSRFFFGFVISWLTGWNWKVLTQKEVDNG